VWVKRFGWFIIFYVVSLVGVLPFVTPPTTRTGWILLVLLAPPGIVFGEWLSGRLFDGLEERTRLQKGLRAGCFIALALAIYIIIGFLKAG
jgi:hypothetical protein